MRRSTRPRFRQLAPDLPADLVDRLLGERRAPRPRRLRGITTRTPEWKSSLCRRMLKYSFNLTDDRLVGAAAVRGRDDAAGVHDRRGHGGPGRVPGAAGPGLTRFPFSTELLTLPQGRCGSLWGHTAYSNWGFCCMPVTVINSVRLHHTDSSVKVRADRRTGE